VPAPRLWQENAVYSGRAFRHFTGVHEGTLSVKAVLSGHGVWRTPDATYSIHPDQYLVLNHGQRYSLEIESQVPTETFVAFFRPGFVESVRESLCAEGLDTKPLHSFEFCERIELGGDEVGKSLLRLKSAVRGETLSAWEAQEGFYELAKALLLSRELVGKEREALLLRKESVREEVHRRLSRARDYLLDSPSQPKDLETAAYHAQLSPNHFHHLFSTAFKTTPHRYLTLERIRRAKLLLRKTNDPLWLIAQNVGFDSESHFCRLFQRETGQKPTAFRQNSED
jgi:AraC-like DNA-binding protein